MARKFHFPKYKKIFLRNTRNFFRADLLSWTFLNFLNLGLKGTKVALTYTTYIHYVYITLFIYLFIYLFTYLCARKSVCLMILLVLKKLKQSPVTGLVAIKVNTDFLERESKLFHKSVFTNTIFQIVTLQQNRIETV